MGGFFLLWDKSPQTGIIITTIMNLLQFCCEPFILCIPLTVSVRCQLRGGCSSPLLTSVVRRPGTTDDAIQLWPRHDHRWSHLQVNHSRHVFGVFQTPLQSFQLALYLFLPAIKHRENICARRTFSSLIFSCFLSLSQICFVHGTRNRGPKKKNK